MTGTGTGTGRLMGSWNWVDLALWVSRVLLQGVSSAPDLMTAQENTSELALEPSGSMQRIAASLAPCQAVPVASHSSHH